VRSFCTALKPPASPAAVLSPGGHAASRRSRPPPLTKKPRRPAGWRSHPLPSASGMISSMRIGTWKLDGRWSVAHQVFMQKQMCHVSLTTEVPERICIQGYTQHLSQDSMLKGERWAGVFSLPSLRLIPPLKDPQPASAAAVVGNTTFVSSILPWRTSGSSWPWVGSKSTEKTRSTLDDLRKHLPRRDLVWGGDWYHSFEGSETAGSNDGRAPIVAALKKLGLWAPTEQLTHRLNGAKSIDHVAVSRQRPNSKGKHLPAFRDDGTDLSDHDAYFVDIRSASSRPIGPRGSAFGIARRTATAGLQAALDEVEGSALPSSAPPRPSALRSHGIRTRTVSIPTHATGARMGSKSMRLRLCMARECENAGERFE
jgi:hypothetical protein